MWRVILAIFIIVSYSCETTKAAEKPIGQHHAAAVDTENLIYLDLKYGRVTIELYPDKAPNHVKRIKELVRAGFYDGVVFHRVIDGFMAQTGDPTGTGRGGSDKPDLKAEFNDIPHTEGVLSMARTADPNSANSQFFIMLALAPHLDGQYTVWGKVIDGMQYVHKIKKGRADRNGSVEHPDAIVKMRVAEDEGQKYPPASLTAQTNTMQFRLEPPYAPEIFGTAWRIYADGPIDVGAANRFKQLVEHRGIASLSNVYLNSPGGFIDTAIELGRLFRKYGMNTYIGKFDPVSNNPSENAYCFSACTLAYIGGKFRYMSEKSTYGVHRFYLNKDLPFQSDIAQISSAQIIQYLTEFDISPSFFIEMTKAGPDQISVLSKKDLKKMGVVNDGASKTEWTIESYPGPTSGFYVKGERDTVYGINKFMVLCSPTNSLVLHVIFDPQGRQDQALEMNAHSLVIDGKFLPYSKHLIGTPVIKNGWINSIYKLPDDDIDRIINGETIGFEFQYAYGAPIFLGIGE